MGETHTTLVLRKGLAEREEMSVEAFLSSAVNVAEICYVLERVTEDKDFAL